MELWNRGGRKHQTERIEALEKAVEGLKSERRHLVLEWESVFDKLNRTMGRLNARIRKSDALSDPPEPEQTDAQPVAPPPMQLVGTHATLSQRRIRRGLLSG